MPPAAAGTRARATLLPWRALLCRGPLALLVGAELRRRFPGRPGEEVVRVVLADLARHVAGDHAVVGEELRDPLDRFERQHCVELGDADRLRGHVLGQARLLGVDLRRARSEERSVGEEWSARDAAD